MRRNKYGNHKTVVDGITFASRAEAKRYGELKLMEKAGEIANIELQPRFPLRIDGKLVATYVGDFSYDLLLPVGRNERGVDQHWPQPFVEDVKGVETPLFKLKAKLFRALYPEIELRIVRSA